MAETTNVCFYIIGGDLERDSGAASADLRELARASVPEGTGVYLLIGGVERWQFPGIPGGETALLTLEGGRFELLERWGDVSMGDGATLERYLRFCRALSPAQRCVLVFWGHGANGMDGVGYDLLFGGDTLTLHEIASGLDAAETHMDIIGFDACAMATLESCWMLAEGCDWLVASTEPEALEGWRHNRWLEALDGDMAEAARRMADTYNEDCARTGKLPSMQAIALPDFRARAGALLSELFEQCAAPDGHATVREVAAGHPRLPGALDALLGDGDLLLGKYGEDNTNQARDLEGIGEAYYRWLTTK